MSETVLVIDPEFESLMPALTDEEYRQLEANLVADGCREPLDVWGDTILDGHHRYALCLEHGLPFQAAQVEGIETRDDAIAWIIAKQLGRRNLTPERKSYYRGKEYLAEKTDGHGKNSGCQNDTQNYGGPVLKTREIIAEKHDVSPRTVQRDAVFAQAVDQLSDIAGADVRSAILDRTANATKKKVVDLAQRETDADKIKEELGLGASQAVKVTVFSSESNEYYTPEKYIEAARMVMGEIDLDPASCIEAQEWIRAGKFYMIADDGLVQEWMGRVWLNPPYGKTGNLSNQEIWSQKLIREYEAGNIKEAILLVKAALGYNWFEKLWCNWPVCFARERLSFIKSDGSNNGQSKQGTAFLYFGDDHQKFKTIFSQFGRVILPDEESTFYEVE